RLVLELQQLAAVRRGDRAGAQGLLQLRRRDEQAERVRDRRRCAADPLAELLLRATGQLQVLAVGAGLLEWREIQPLEVLDERGRGLLGLVEGHDPGGDLLLARELRRRGAPGSGDRLVV